MRASSFAANCKEGVERGSPQDVCEGLRLVAEDPGGLFLSSKVYGGGGGDCGTPLSVFAGMVENGTRKDYSLKNGGREK